MKVEAPASYASPEEVWTSLFDSLCERIGPCFARSETRERVKAYLRGLLSPIERKNGWQLAEEAGLPTPYAMQYLLKPSGVGERRGARSTPSLCARDDCRIPMGCWSWMKRAFSRKGEKSVGVQRQYSGTAGRIENCQIGVFVTYASQAGHTLVDRELYLPKSWTQDPERCRAANVPEEVVFATKPELAARMLWRTLEAGLCAKWVTGDTRLWESSSSAGRSGSAQAGVCVGGLMSGAGAGAGRTQARGSHRTMGLAPDQWQRLSAGDGSKGPREFDWARVELSKPEQDGWQRWLVVRRSLVSGEKPADLAYVLVFAPGATTLAEMAALLERVGPWSTVLKRAKERLAWISMKCDPGRDGTVTSLCACSLTPFSWSCEHRVR